ncbi:MAG: glycosyltransferase family 4 protein [bacterium]|nr:glycosyltransferase family 4 protein [bacterium]
MDRKESALGFFQKWVISLAPHYGSIEVICLKEGEHTLPANARVHSLGKENISGPAFLRRLRYVVRFYQLVWSLRKDYDAVFVHMNQEYILLAGIFWKLFGKKVYMWRNHYEGSFLTNIAAMFCNRIFCTSKYSYTARLKKTVLMSVGVDVESAHMDEPILRIPRSILFLGRLDESKRPDVLIDALGILKNEGIDFTASFVGGPSKEDSDYPAVLRAQVEKLGIADRITFVGAVPNTETYRYYRSSENFVNCSRSGMLDKTIFKAAVCGCLVLATSRDFAELVGEKYIFEENNPEMLAKKLDIFLSATKEERVQLHNALSESIKKHSLPVLVENLIKQIVI